MFHIIKPDYLLRLYLGSSSPSVGLFMVEYSITSHAYLVSQSSCRIFLTSMANLLRLKTVSLCLSSTKVSFLTLKSNYFQVGHKLGVCGAYVRDRGVPMHEDGAEDDSCQHGWRGHNCSATQDRPSLKSWSDIHMTREK